MNFPHIAPLSAGLTPAERGAPPRRRFSLLNAFRRKNVGYPERVALVLIIVLTLVLVVAQWITPHGAKDIVGTPLTAPDGDFLLGTDSQGRDVFSRVLLGLQASWFGALGVIVFGVLVGGTIGLIAGMLGGIIDTVLMRLTDAALALPGTLVALMVVAALGPSLQNTLIAVAVTWWPWYARIVRGQTRTVMSLPHADAARLGGFSRTRMALVHVLPGSIGPILVAASLDVGSVLLVLAGLSFIGLGSASPAAEIGSMSADGLTFIFNAPWIALAPAVALFIVALLANFAGDALRELAD
ncbi:ABC transporter permease [Cryobacterium sp. SO2]|uniref:ABC transporter permease n=1 Tax=Cryobacterium sp. SO2 TaxID=1897060 RepID=UPI00223D05E3|nr:ABC transporter permease [Cryobacterium sp. SO2]WEO75801.1 ABC transporter permease [Cryobacterium sp. SO2]